MSRTKKPAGLKGKVAVMKIAEILWTKKAVAREIGISPELFQEWIAKGWLPGPEVLHVKRFYYDSKGVEAVKRAAQQVQDRKAKKAAGFSRGEMAEECGTAIQVFLWHLKMKNVPEPANGTRYTIEEAAYLIKYFEARRNVPKIAKQFCPGLKAMGLSSAEIEYAKRYKKELLEGVESIVLGNGRTDTWYRPEQLAKVASRVRLRRIALQKKM